MKLLRKVFGISNQEAEFENGTISPLVCRMSAMVDVIRLEELKNVFLDIVVFEYKGEIHREGMVLSDEFAPQKTAYLFDDELYPDLNAMIYHTCLSDYEEQIKVLGFGGETDGTDLPPYEVVYDIRSSEDYRVLEI